MSFVTLLNNELTVKLSAHGAEIKSITDKRGFEYIWEGNPAVWSGQTPLLFPIAGGLKEDQYVLNGKKYTQLKHGFARLKEFDIEKQDHRSVTFLLMADEDTRKGFPYEFKLRVTYTLSGSRLDVTYSVDNPNTDTMYFSIGAHEGYACPGGIEGYDIEFDENETLKASKLHGNLLGYEQGTILENSRVLPLKEEYFVVDALVFLQHNSKGVTLVNRTSGRRLRVDFPGFPYLLLWTKPHASYLCIEPWHGIPDFIDSDQDITHKRGIIALESDSEFTSTHAITIL